MSPPVPEHEREVYECIVGNRANLRRFLTDFQTSVALFELLERGGGPPSTGVLGGEFFQYRIIAARDGALNIYHAKCSLEAIKKQLPQCPSLNPFVDPKDIRRALKIFNQFFPNCDNVRHAIAHAGEIFSSPRIMKKHEQRDARSHPGFTFGTATIKPGVGGGWFVHSLWDRTYSVGIEGDIFSIAIDQTSIAKMEDVICLVDSAFAKLFASNEISAAS